MPKKARPPTGGSLARQRRTEREVRRAGALELRCLLVRRRQAEGGDEPRLFVTKYRTPQLRIFALDELGEDGWLRVLELDEYAARSRNEPESIQGAVFLPGSPVARIARVRSPHLNRVTLCRTERHKH